MLSEGLKEGFNDGLFEGATLGSAVGLSLGNTEGRLEGWFDGAIDRLDEGKSVGMVCTLGLVEPKELEKGSPVAKNVTDS